MDTSHNTPKYEEIDQALDNRLSRFSLNETGLLNERRFDEWAELLSDDFRYQVPVPYTVGGSVGAARAESFVIEESRQSIVALWFVRSEPKFSQWAWGDASIHHIRRFVTGLCISLTDRKDTWRLQSNVLLSFARQSDPVTLVPAGRDDLVREVDGILKLARRVVHLDQTVMSTTHMRIIF